MSEILETLLGKKLVGVKISKDKTVICFEMKNGGYRAIAADGECCSSSWFEHCQNAEALSGATVTKIAVREMTEHEEPGKGDGYIKVYGFEVVTDRGTFYIELRNASNGYYGGYLVEVKLSDLRGPLEPLTEDF